MLLNKLVMTNKTLVKSKIVLESNGTGLVTYLWKKTFWIFGYWYPYGSSSCSGGFSEKKLSRINDDEVSKIFFNEFIASDN
jgi:hypothetical protein